MIREASSKPSPDTLADIIKKATLFFSTLKEATQYSGVATYLKSVLSLIFYFDIACRHLVAGQAISKAARKNYECIICAASNTA